MFYERCEEIEDALERSQSADDEVDDKSAKKPDAAKGKGGAAAPAAKKK
jgi:hypothetical protein